MSQDVTNHDSGATSAKALENNKNALRELAPIAISTLGALIQSPGTSDRVRCDASKAVLDRIGLLPTAENRHNGNITLSDVSIAELRRIADKLEGELAARARPVKGARPVSPDVKEIKESGS